MAVSAGPGRAQNPVPAILGGTAGLLAGGLVSVGIWTLKARHGDYAFSARDALGWESIPIPLGLATGITVGALDSDRLERGFYGGAAGLVLGAGVGTLIGDGLWERPEGPWTGGIIGAAAGVTLGGIVGLAWPGGDDDGGSVPPVTIRVPVGF